MKPQTETYSRLVRGSDQDKTRGPTQRWSSRADTFLLFKTTAFSRVQTKMQRIHSVTTDFLTVQPSEAAAALHHELSLTPDRSSSTVRGSVQCACAQDALHYAPWFAHVSRVTRHVNGRMPLNRGRCDAAKQLVMRIQWTPLILKSRLFRFPNDSLLQKKLH